MIKFRVRYLSNKMVHIYRSTRQSPIRGRYWATHPGGVNMVVVVMGDGPLP